MRFPFCKLPNTATITCCHVLDEKKPILYVSHDKDDGMWQFLCGQRHEFDDARAEDVFPIVREGFRTHEDQVKVFEDKVSAYIREGYRRRKAEELAEQWVAVPGTSEHELGLAVDINADNSRSTNDEVYIWLAENAWRYGFILRYPQGKEGITGIDYEPWHYRYVGKEAASEIYEERITLEEYLEEGGADRDG